MTATQAGWLKVLASAAMAVQTALLAADEWTVKTVVLAVLGALVSGGMTAWALYQAAPPSSPPTPPAPSPGAPVTTLALLFGLGLIAAGWSCYATTGTPPSCAADPTQEGCAGWPPPLLRHADGGGQ